MGMHNSVTGYMIVLNRFNIDLMEIKLLTFIIKGVGSSCSSRFPKGKMEKHDTIEGDCQIFCFSISSMWWTNSEGRNL